MAIVRKFSIRYLILSGEHKGRICVYHSAKEESGLIKVILVDSSSDEFYTVGKGELASLETPGWPESMNTRSYGLEEYLEKHKGNGDNILRSAAYAQPRTLKVGDILATSEAVIEFPRKGYNSSILIRLDKTGWVELAGRLPIALEGNENSKFPAELRKGERLVTECLVSKDPVSNEVNWTDIFLDHHIDSGIETPSCVPLAMA